MTVAEHLDCEMRDALYLLVVCTLALLLYATGQKCEETSTALETLKIKVDSMAGLLRNDSKVDHFIRQLKDKRISVEE